MKEQVKDFSDHDGGTASWAAAVIFLPGAKPCVPWAASPVWQWCLENFHSLANLSDHYDLECGTADRGIFVYRQGIWWKNGVYVVLIAGDNRNSGEIIS